MRKTSFHILRIGLAITFLWVGVLIFKNPEAWAGYLQPWAINLLPVTAGQAMLGSAFLDIIIGLLFLAGVFVWQAALLAAVHLVIILIASGINDIMVRDIGILAGALSLLLSARNK